MRKPIRLVAIFHYDVTRDVLRYAQRMRAIETAFVSGLFSPENYARLTEPERAERARFIYERRLG